VNFYLRHHLPPIVNGVVVCGTFGVLYFAATLTLGVPEARATLSRFTRKR
jgi:hypothetical protein